MIVLSNHKVGNTDIIISYFITGTSGEGWSAETIVWKWIYKDPKYRSEKESCLLVCIVPYWLMHAWSYNMLKPCSQMVTSSCLPMMWEPDSWISASSKCHHGFSLVLCTRYTRLGLGSCIIITPWWVGQPCGFYAPDMHSCSCDTYAGIMIPHWEPSWWFNKL